MVGPMKVLQTSVRTFFGMLHFVFSDGALVFACETTTFLSSLIFGGGVTTKGWAKIGASIGAGIGAGIAAGIGAGIGAAFAFGFVSGRGAFGFGFAFGLGFGFALARGLAFALARVLFLTACCFFGAVSSLVIRFQLCVPEMENEKRMRV
jgi:hypothetical protein